MKIKVSIIVGLKSYTKHSVTHLVTKYFNFSEICIQNCSFFRKIESIIFQFLELPITKNIFSDLSHSHRTNKKFRAENIEINLC